MSFLTLFLWYNKTPLIAPAPMEVTLLPVPISKVILFPMTLTLLTEDKPTQVRVVDHLATKYAAWRAIILTAVINDTLGLTLLMLTLLKLLTAHVLLLTDSRLLIGF